MGMTPKPSPPSCAPGWMRLNAAAFCWIFSGQGMRNRVSWRGSFPKPSPAPWACPRFTGGGLTCPVFLPPVPPDVNLADYLAPWQGREIWLELALDGEAITLTPSGAITAPLPPAAQLLGGHRDEKLHCHYQIHTDADSARFTLFRTPEDLDELLIEGEALGVTRAVGLYQELHGIPPFLTDPE